MKKMKRILVALLSCTMAFACVAGLSACDEPTSSSPAASSSSEVTDSSSSDSTPAECTHSGGTATCTELAKCDLCGEAYGELAAHVWVENAGSPASCTDNGTKAHFECENCDAVSLDGESATEESLVIEATGHTWGDLIPAEEGNCVVNGKKEHYACECGALAVDGEEEGVKVEVTEEELIVAAPGHVWAGVLPQEVSCTQDGYPAHFVCTTCNAQSLDRKTEVCIRVEPATGHNWVADFGKPATCQEEGIPAHWLCTTCNITALEKDGAPVCLMPIPVDADAYHANVFNLTYEEGLAPDCVNPGYTEYYVCNTCNEIVSGKEELPANGHAWEEVEAQSFCEEEGWKAHYVCACGAISLDGENECDPADIVVPARGHMCIPEGFTAEVPATCQDGMRAYYVCGYDDCDAIVCDENGDKVVYASLDELVIPATEETTKAHHAATGHYVLGHNATCDKDGNIEHYECDDCDATFDVDGNVIEVVIPATNHNWMNAYDYLYEEVMGAYGRGYITLQEAYAILDDMFPYGRNTDGYYCEFGPICPDCETMKTGIGHTGGEATCSDLAVCDRCLSEYGDYADVTDAANHNYIYDLEAGYGKPGTAATCSEDGAYKLAQCEDCLAYAAVIGEEYVYVGFDLETEEAKEIMKIPADATNADWHNWVSDYENGIGAAGRPEVNCTAPALYKVDVCDICGQNAKYVEDHYEFLAEGWTDEDRIAIPAYNHTKDGVSTIVLATCTEDAYCTLCNASGAALGENADYLAHHVWADELTVVENPVCGKVTVNVAHYACVRCSDEVKKEDGTVVPYDEANYVYRNHTIVDATCTADAYCSNEGCGASGAELGDKPEYLAHHEWSVEPTKANQQPTCTEPGQLKYWSCECTCCEEGCNAIRKEVDGGYAEGTDVDANEDGIIDFVYVAPLGHDFKNFVSGWKYDCHPEHTSNGQSDYYKCTRFDECGAKSLDGKTPIASDDELVIVAEHTWGDLQETKKTCDTTGLKPHYVCSGCGSYTEDKETLVAYDSLIVPASHEYGEWIEKDPEDCQNDGFEAHYHCVECDKYFDADKNEVEKESLVIKKGPHVCAHPERYCSDYVNCDVCGQAYKYERDDSLYASHKWNDNGECKFCDAIKDAPEADVPEAILPGESEGSESEGEVEIA